MISVWLSEVNVPEATVITGVPMVVSVKKKLPAPLTALTAVTVPSKAPLPLVSNTMVAEVALRSTVPKNPVAWLSN